MKCGKETKSDRFFCQEGLDEMERYPVKPDTPVYLPPVIRQERKTQRFSPPPAPEEQVAQLRRTNRRLRVFLLLAVLIVGVLCDLSLLPKETQDAMVEGRYQPVGTSNSETGCFTGNIPITQQNDSVT